MKNAMDTWRTEFVQKKAALARRLAAGQCGGSYGEAAMILCATVSALAAEVWRDDGIDRVRFTQVLVDFAPEDLHPTRVSIPLLLGHLRAKKRDTERDVIQKTFLPDDTPGQILIGDDV